MRVIVTGGAGFIGAHLVEALLKWGHTVTVLDNLSSGDAAFLDGLAINFVEADVADFDRVQTAVAGCDVVFHLAALVSVPQSIADPVLNHSTNVTGTFHVFEAARLAGVKRVVYASSAAVYGNLPGLPKREDMPLHPDTPYAMAKRTAELTAAVYSELYQIKTVGLRFMNVFGPRQDPGSPYSGVLSIFCQRSLENKPVIIYGDGQQTRDFVYISDVTKAIMAAGFSQWWGGGKAAVINIGRGQQMSLNDIIQTLEEINGRSIEVRYLPSRKGDIKHSVADISRAKTALGYYPEATVSEGLRQTISWYRSQFKEIR